MYIVCNITSVDFCFYGDIYSIPYLKLDDVLHLVAGQVQLDAVIDLQAQDDYTKSNAKWSKFQLECSRISV